MDEINTHNLRVEFGKHCGELYTRVPVSYLLWMVNCGHSQKHIAEAELKRRGTVVPTIDITGHAIDRASQNSLDVWQSTKKKDEGFHAWLIRVATEALKRNEKDQKGRYRFKGMAFAFQMDGAWPVLQTVIRKRKK